MSLMSESISQLLAKAVRGEASANATVSLSEIVSALGARSFGVVLVLFGLPNLLPVPGLPMLCGVVVGVIAYQMLQGREMLSLPTWLGKRQLNRADLTRIIQRAEPSLNKLERVMHPRLPQLTGEGSLKLVGFALLLLTFALMAPIPFFGGIAPGIAVTLIGLAWSARDGVFVAIGLVVTLLALGFTGFITYTILKQIAVFMYGIIGLG